MKKLRIARKRMVGKVKTYKLAIIAPDTLPIPALKGGAIETLTTSFLMFNENEKQWEIEVYQWPGNNIKNSNIELTNTKIKEIKKTFWGRILKRIGRTGLIQTLCPGYINSKDWFSKGCVKEIIKSEPDLILLEGCTWYMPYFRKKLPAAHLVLHVHTDILNRESYKSTEIIHAADKIIAVSEYIKEKICEIDITQKFKISVLKNGINTNVFNVKHREGREKIRKKLGYENEDKVIIFCGRITQAKGIQILLQAMDFLPKEYKLLVVGASWFSSAVKNDFEKEMVAYALKYKSRVKFMGYIANQKLAQLYCAADICVAPSICEDAANLVVVEAAACGLPVISTKKGGIPEYTAPGHARLIEVDEKMVENLVNSIESIFQNKEDYKRMAVNAFAFAQKLDEIQFGENFMNLLKQVLESSMKY